MNAQPLHFHPHGDRSPLRLPLALGHFLPWFTVRSADFPLSSERAASIAHLPHLEDHRHWSNAPGTYRRAHLHMPEIGTYDSRDPKVIRWQIESARAAGLAGFIINWYGQNSVENVITFPVLDEIERWNRDHPAEPFVYLFSIDSQAQRATEGRVPASLAHDVQYIRRELMRPSYLLRDGRPVFTCFPYKDDLPDWIAAFDGGFGKDAYDFIWMYEARGRGETGCFVWVRPDDNATDHASLYPWPDPDNTGAAFADRLYGQWSEPQFGHRYGMGGVWPGFNDTLVTWAWKDPSNHARARPRVIAREAQFGNTYERLWETYLNCLRDPARLPLPLVQIVTWNDWAETTTIEPSREFGRKYVEMTRRFVSQAEDIWRERFGG